LYGKRLYRKTIKTNNKERNKRMGIMLISSLIIILISFIFGASIGVISGYKLRKGEVKLEDDINRILE
jgi:hypothetical protein